MQQSKELVIDYQPFYGHRASYTIQPYAMKAYHQRWYIVGFIKELDAIRNIALDRLLEISITEQSFAFPEKFNAEKYYRAPKGLSVDISHKDTHTHTHPPFSGGKNLGSSLHKTAKLNFTL